MIIIPPPKQFPRHRPRPRRTPPTPTPPVGTDSIVSLVHDGTNAVIAELSAALLGITPSNGMWVTPDEGGTWFGMSGASIIDDTHVQITFDSDVSACTVWHVEDPGMWEWEDGGPMNGPLDGPLM